MVLENKPDKLTGIRLAKNSNVKSRWNSGICSLCGKWCEMITQEHAKEHGFKNADEMAKAGMIKRGINVKKIGLLLCMLMLMSLSSVFANGMTDGVDITGKRYDASVEYKMVPQHPQPDMSERGNYLYLNHNIPICGVSEAAVYYLDLTSCNYYVEDGVAYVSCIVYAGSGGADGQGNPGKIAKKTYRFSTFKNNGQRNIRLLSCVDKNGENVTAREYKWDNGFLYSIFWKAADKVGLSQYLD